MQFVILAIATLLQATEVTSQTCKLIKIPEPVTVPHYLRDWKINYTEYEPVEWNEECGEDSCDPALPDGLKFNTKHAEVDRRRARACLKRPKYSISSDGYPLNPAGRTGLKGRGIFKRWGPNHLVKLVLVKKTETDTKILMQKTENATMVPETFIDTVGDSLQDGNTERKIFERLLNKNRTEEKARKLIKQAKKKFTEVLSGNVPSTLNTDHAWVEIHLRVINCKHNEEYCDAVGDVLYEQNYKWTSLNDTDSAKKIGTKPHLIGEELTKSQLKDYGVFCRIRGRKALKIMREVAIGVGVTILAFLIAIVFIEIAAPSVGLGFGSLIAIVLALETIPTGITTYRIYRHLKCK